MTVLLSGTLAAAAVAIAVPGTASAAATTGASPPATAALSMAAGGGCAQTHSRIVAPPRTHGQFHIEHNELAPPIKDPTDPHDLRGVIGVACANTRTDPFLGAPVIRRLPAGSPVRIACATEAQSRTWYMIDQGNRAWIAADLVTTITDASHPDSTTYPVPTCRTVQLLS